MKNALSTDYMFLEITNKCNEITNIELNIVDDNITDLSIEEEKLLEEEIIKEEEKLLEEEKILEEEIIKEEDNTLSKITNENLDIEINKEPIKVIEKEEPKKRHYKPRKQHK